MSVGTKMDVGPTLTCDHVKPPSKSLRDQKQMGWIDERCRIVLL